MCVCWGGATIYTGTMHTPFRNRGYIWVNGDTPSVKTRGFHRDTKKRDILTEPGRCVGTRGAGQQPRFQLTKAKGAGAPAKILTAVTGRRCQKCQRKVPDEAPRTLRRLTSGSGMAPGGPGPTGSHGRREDDEHPALRCTWVIFLTWERSPGTSDHGAPGARRSIRVLRQVSTGVRQYRGHVRLWTDVTVQTTARRMCPASIRWGSRTQITRTGEP